MELIYGFVRAHGYEFSTHSDHRTDVCTWCAQAKDTALAHMKDATLKTTRSIKREPDDTPHAVRLTRLGRDNTNTIPINDPLGLFGVSGTFVRQGEGLDPIDMSDRGLNRYVNTATPNEKTLITEVVNLRIKLSRQRPVVLDLEEGEAALVLDLLHDEVDSRSVEADVNYQNGSGFERECAQAREAERQTEAVADRLRSKLAKHLDKAYAGELGL